MSAAEGAAALCQEELSPAAPHPDSQDDPTSCEAGSCQAAEGAPRAAGTGRRPRGACARVSSAPTSAQLHVQDALFPTIDVMCPSEYLIM